MRHPFDGTNSGEEPTAVQKTAINRRTMLKKAAAFLAGAGAAVAGAAFAGGATTMAVGEEGGGGGRRPSRGSSSGKTKTGPSKSELRARAKGNKDLASANALLKSRRIVLAYRAYDDLYRARRRFDGGLNSNVAKLSRDIQALAKKMVQEADAVAAKAPTAAVVADYLEVSKLTRLDISKVAYKKLRSLQGTVEYKLALLEYKARLKYDEIEEIRAEIKSGALSDSKVRMASINIRYMLKSIVKLYTDTPTGQKAAAELEKMTG